jgi:hypothetical protein
MGLLFLALTPAAAELCTLVPQPSFAVDTGTYGSGGVSGSVPAPEFCLAWTLAVNITDPACSAADSLLLFEMFLVHTSSGLPVDLRQTVDGLLLMASRSADPRLGVTAGVAVFEPERGLGMEADPTLNATYLDATAAANGMPMQRFNVSIGALLASGESGLNASHWHMTLANANEEIASSAYTYTIRTTCMPGPSLPCPRPTSAAASTNECNGQGTCTRPSDSPEVNYCACSTSNYAGDTCGVSVTDLAALGITKTGRRLTQSSQTEMLSSVNVDVPPATWRYFHATVPPSDFSTLRTELKRPVNSAGAYRAAIQVADGRLPTRAEFDPRSLSTGGYSRNVWAANEACTCISCSCYVPYQAESLSYDLRVHGQTTVASTYIIGVYNNLATSTPIGQLLNLSVTWTSNGRDLCPNDCSGRGDCINYATGDGAYACKCRPEYGGAYCQGALDTQVLGAERGYASGPVVMSPGHWSFHLFSTEVGGTLTMQFAEDEATSPLFLIFAPLYATSFGDQYFLPTTWSAWGGWGGGRPSGALASGGDRTQSLAGPHRLTRAHPLPHSLTHSLTHPLTLRSWVFNKSMGVQIPGSTGSDGDRVGYIVGVLNSQTESAAISTYEITIALPAGGGLTFLSTLQVGGRTEWVHCSWVGALLGWCTGWVHCSWVAALQVGGRTAGLRGVTTCVQRRVSACGLI